MDVWEVTEMEVVVFIVDIIVNKEKVMVKETVVVKVVNMWSLTKVKVMEVLVLEVMEEMVVVPVVAEEY